MPIYEGYKVEKWQWYTLWWECVDMGRQWWGHWGVDIGQWSAEGDEWTWWDHWGGMDSGQKVGTWLTMAGWRYNVWWSVHWQCQSQTAVMPRRHIMQFEVELWVVWDNKGSEWPPGPRVKTLYRVWGLSLELCYAILLWCLDCNFQHISRDYRPTPPGRGTSSTYTTGYALELCIGTFIWYVSYRQYFEPIHNMYSNISGSIIYG